MHTARLVSHLVVCKNAEITTSCSIFKEVLQWMFVGLWIADAAENARSSSRLLKPTQELSTNTAAAMWGQGWATGQEYFSAHRYAADWEWETFLRWPLPEHWSRCQLRFALPEPLKAVPRPQFKENHHAYFLYILSGGSDVQIRQRCK